MRGSTIVGAAAAAILVSVMAPIAARSVPVFLMPNEPNGRGLLVVEGWISHRALRMAAATFREGGYEAILVTGGPVREDERFRGYATYAEQGAARLRRLGIPDPDLVVVSSPGSSLEHTYLSAVSVRRWIESNGSAVRDLDVFSQGPHTRRSRDTFRAVLGPGVAVGSIAAPPPSYDVTHWWISRRGLADVLVQSVKYVSARLFFRAGALERELLQHGAPSERAAG